MQLITEQKNTENIPKSKFLARDFFREDIWKVGEALLQVLGSMKEDTEFAL